MELRRTQLWHPKLNFSFVLDAVSTTDSGCARPRAAHMWLAALG